MRKLHVAGVDRSGYGFFHDIRVRFAETDAMGIVHHAAYLPYLEEARVAWLRERGLPYHAIRDLGVDIAVLEVAVRYVRPLRFDDVVTVGVRIAHTTRTTFQVGYLLMVDGEVRATGVTAHGCVDPSGRPLRLPEALRALAAANEHQQGDGHGGGPGAGPEPEPR